MIPTLGGRGYQRQSMQADWTVGEEDDLNDEDFKGPHSGWQVPGASGGPRNRLECGHIKFMLAYERYRFSK
jgi:hypothetical protein